MYAHAEPKSGPVKAADSACAPQRQTKAPTAQAKLEGALNGSARVQSQLHMSDALNQSPRATVQAKLAQLMSSPVPFGRMQDGQGMSDEEELIQSKSAVQRQDMEEDDLLQRMPVQREDMDEDELAQMKSTTAQREDMDEDELAQMQSSTVQREDMDDDELAQMKSMTVQREDLDEDELAQMKSATAQREDMDEEDVDEDDLAQMKSKTAQREDMDEDEPAQMKSITAQRQDMPEEDELLQRMPVQRRANTTGMPDQLKGGIESLSGMSMDGVNVHYNSSKPASLQAHAYTQGSDIHVAPGQERHLAHEAWHVVQQAQGRVQPTMQLQGTAVNDDPGLEDEADVMGAKALQMASMDRAAPQLKSAGSVKAGAAAAGRVYQRVSNGAVAQLFYFLDRSKNQWDDIALDSSDDESDAPSKDEKKKDDREAPVWVDGKPPQNLLLSGRFNDGKHGPDDLYVLLGGTDLFYGISFEGEMKHLEKEAKKIAKEKGLDLSKNEKEIIEIYVSRFGPLPEDVEFMKEKYGGSSGWDQYLPYRPGASLKATTESLTALNPNLPWANAPTEIGCQVAMIEAIKRGGSVRFLLNGLSDIKGLLEKTGEWSDKITGHELRFVIALLGKTVKTGANEQVKPEDGVNVFFYLNKKPFEAKWLGHLAEAQKLAAKLAEEEEWDEQDEAESLAELMEALARGLTPQQIQEALQLT